MVAAAVRTIFAQPNQQAAGQQLQEVGKRVRSTLAESREGTSRRGTRCVGVYGLSPGTLDAYVFYELAGTAQP
jgi:hypothetical protein